jgi:hypothetical protein
MPLPTLGLGPTTHMEKKKKKKGIFKNSKFCKISTLENIKNQECYVTNSLFSLKNIGQTFEKSFFFFF